MASLFLPLILTPLNNTIYFISSVPFQIQLYIDCFRNAMIHLSLHLKWNDSPFVALKNGTIRLSFHLKMERFIFRSIMNETILD